MHYVCSVPSLELDKKSSSRAITSSENEVVDLDACLATFSHRTFRAFYRRPPALNRVREEGGRWQAAHCPSNASERRDSRTAGCTSGR